MEVCILITTPRTKALADFEPCTATAAFAVPTGWAGNVAIGDAVAAITGDDSLIEANFVVPPGYSVAVADVDVSFV